MRPIWLTLIPVLLADQALKFWIKLNCRIGDRIELVDGLIELQFIENEGMAFGWALPGASGKLVLSLFRVLAAVAISFYVQKLVREGAAKGLVRSVTLIWAGAVGNILDSLSYGVLFSKSGWHAPACFLPADGGYAGLFMGHVVDMFHFTTRWPTWFPIDAWQGREIFPPIWNFADAAIFIGVAWILIRQRSYFGGEAVETSSAGN